MTLNNKIVNYVIDVIRKLQKAGYETYLVGGAVRDILLDIQPKDYDISTEATPAQIREVFGKRNARIIGRRFRIVHLYYHSRKYLEISTFRRSPNEKDVRENSVSVLKRDNLYGNAYEDAWRRDFTVNSIFYDPVNDQYKDYTENGLSDLRDGIVRSIGDPSIRFTEDPVRLLRALKLVSQYNFKLTDGIENIINNTVDQIHLCSISRLLLEFEKICRKPYSAATFRVFMQYGFLSHYLPYLAKYWNTPQAKLAVQLLQDYNDMCIKHSYASHYTTSLVILTLPFVNYNQSKNEKFLFWDIYPEIEKDIQHTAKKIFFPYILSGFRMNSISTSIMLLKKMYIKHKITKVRLNQFYKSSRDVLVVADKYLAGDQELVDFWLTQRPKKNARRKPVQKAITHNRRRKQYS